MVSVACRMAFAIPGDVVFYDLGKNFFYSDGDSDGLQEMFRRWGLGSKTQVDLPAENDGRVPDAEWKEAYFKDWSPEERAWSAGDMTNIAIGQGDILVTPIQMATVYAGIAMGGVEYTPHVLHSVVSRDGQGDAFSYEPKKLRMVELKNQGAQMDLVHRALLSMIYEESPKLAEHFRNLPVQVAGKSGTGEKAGEDDYAWFVAYAPYDDPKYVVAALLEQGGFGGTCAMPAVRHVLGAIYDCPDTVSYDGGDTSR